VGCRLDQLTLFAQEQIRWARLSIETQIGYRVDTMAKDVPIRLLGGSFLFMGGKSKEMTQLPGFASWPEASHSQGVLTSIDM
jgi:hypothetical protein